MISYIKGTLEAVYEDGIVIDNHGIGYDIKTPVILLHHLPEIGSEMKIFTYMYVREDALGLFGFLTKEELEVFRLLIAISGIGPKAGLAILSTLTIEQLRFAVLSDDAKTIAKAPGIGAKSAKRLIIELKDKMSLNDLLPFAEDSNDGGEAAPAADAKTEAALALVGLGYSNSDALKAIQAVDDSSEMDTETLLKAALKKMI